MDQMSENQENSNSNNIVADNSIINSANTTVMDVMTFDDADIINETSSGFVENMRVSNWALNDVRDMFKRPFRNKEIKYNVSWTSGQVVYINPIVPLVTGAFSEYMKKYSTINCKICCQVRVNAQPFQTGAFQLAYVPPGLMTNTSPGNEDFYINELNGRDDMAIESIPFISGLPFSQINVLPTATSSLIKVPFKWCVDVENLNTLNMGVFVFQPLQSLGSKIAADFAQIIVYTWLEDIEVEGASGTVASTFVVDSYTPTLVDQTNIHALYRPTPRPPITLQAATKAEESMKVSTVAKTVGNVAGMLSKIPIISDIAGPVSLVADMTSKVAGMFGFSKPFIQDPVTNVNIQKPFGHLNVDGAFCGTKLSVNRNQEIPIHPMGYVKEDEMSTSYVIEKPALWGAFRWEISKNAETLLMSTRISPGIMAIPCAIPGSADQGQANTYLSYLAGIFNFWRGPIKLRFTVIANSFYSGRMRVVYEPRAPPGTTPADTSIAHVLNVSEVFDIKDANVFDFEIPWVIENDWLPTVVQTTSGLSNYDLGRLTVWVENELRTNAQCPDVIAVWVHVMGTGDTQFCIPRAMVGVFPNTAGAFPSVTFTDHSIVEREAVSLQGKFDNVIQSIGDPSLSLRPLLKRYEQLEDDFPVNRFRSPWALSNIDTTLLNWITRMYVHQAGSMRYWIPSHNLLTVRLGIGDAGSATNADSEEILATSAASLIYTSDDMVDIEIPFYNVYPRIAMQAQRWIVDDATHFNYKKTLGRTQTPIGFSLSNADNLMYRSAGDDFNCGMLMGPRKTSRYSTYTVESGSVPLTLSPLG